MILSQTRRFVGTLDGATAAFGAAAIGAIVLNTILACLEDLFDPLSDLMASLSGNHWVSHGIIVVAAFLAAGMALKLGGARFNGLNLVFVLVVATLAAGCGMILWFALF
jgi:hypothetical protein